MRGDIDYGDFRDYRDYRARGGYGGQLFVRRTERVFAREGEQRIIIDIDALDDRRRGSGRVLFDKTKDPPCGAFEGGGKVIGVRFGARRLGPFGRRARTRLGSLAHFVHLKGDLYGG